MYLVYDLHSTVNKTNRIVGQNDCSVIFLLGATHVSSISALGRHNKLLQLTVINHKASSIYTYTYITSDKIEPHCRLWRCKLLNP